MGTGRTTLRSGHCIGRIGRLAAVLGIGAAVVSMPAVAGADTGSPGSTSSPPGADSAAQPRTHSAGRTAAGGPRDSTAQGSRNSRPPATRFVASPTPAAALPPPAPALASRSPRVASSPRVANWTGPTFTSAIPGPTAGTGTAAGTPPAAASAPATTAVARTAASGFLSIPRSIATWLGSRGGDNAPSTGPLAWTVAAFTRRELGTKRTAGAAAAATGQSAPIADFIGKFIGNGTADHPDAGILIGNGFSYSAGTCVGETVCDGGDGGILGDGGDGFNGGNGGHAGWFGTGGAGGDGLAGQSGGDGGRGGLFIGSGGNGGDGGDSTSIAGVGGNGGNGGATGRLSVLGFGGNGGHGGNGGDGNPSTTAFSPSTDQGPYTVPLIDGVTTEPLFTVGETTVLSSTETPGGYRLTGIPDGLGAYTDDQGLVHLFMNHEFFANRQSGPNPGEFPVTIPVLGNPLNPGVKGAYVSEIILDPQTGNILSGDQAFTQVMRWNVVTQSFDNLTTEWKDLSTNTYKFSKFCSGYLGGPEVGLLDRIFFTGEEDGANTVGLPDPTFDGLGGERVAVADGVAYVLPEMGHFQQENAVVIPTPDNSKTYLVIPEDKGVNDSQLYLWVGTKQPDDPNPMVRNGLVGGDLYVFRAKDQEITGEGQFGKGDGTLQGEWVLIPKYIAIGPEQELQTYVASVNAFNFARVEDVAVSKSEAGLFYFTATGGGADAETSPNFYGRVYQMQLNDQTDPLAGGGLTTLLQATNPGDGVINPDNLDINRQGQLMIQENPNREMRGNYPFDWSPENPTGGEAAIWQYDTTTGALTAVAQQSQYPAAPVWPTSADNPAKGGQWESSGIIDASAVYGQGAWLFDVQANSLSNDEVYQLITGSPVPTTAPPDFKVFDKESGGQLLLLRTANPLDGGVGGNGGAGGDGGWILGGGGNGGDGGDGGYAALGGQGGEGGTGGTAGTGRMLLVFANDGTIGTDGTPGSAPCASGCPLNRVFAPYIDMGSLDQQANTWYMNNTTDPAKPGIPSLLDTITKTGIEAGTLAFVNQQGFGGPLVWGSAPPPAEGQASPNITFDSDQGKRIATEIKTASAPGYGFETIVSFGGITACNNGVEIGQLNGKAAFTKSGQVVGTGQYTEVFTLESPIDLAAMESGSISGQVQFNGATTDIYQVDANGKFTFSHQVKYEVPIAVAGAVTDNGASITIEFDKPVVGAVYGPASTQLTYGLQVGFDQMKAAYTDAIQYFYDLGVRHFDLDIEGDALDIASAGINNQRNRVFKAIQDSGMFPDMELSYVLPIGPNTGWAPNSNPGRLIQGAALTGVKISTWNMMAFDYGPQVYTYMLNNQQNMVDMLIAEADTGIKLDPNNPILGAVDYLVDYYKVATDRADAFQKLGVTLMVGQDDTVYDPRYPIPAGYEAYDAAVVEAITPDQVGGAGPETVMKWAADNGVGLLSFWSLGRDRPSYYTTTYNPTLSVTYQTGSPAFGSLDSTKVPGGGATTVTLPFTTTERPLVSGGLYNLNNEWLGSFTVEPNNTLDFYSLPDRLVKPTGGTIDPATGVLQATFNGSVTDIVWARINVKPEILPGGEYQSQDLVYTNLLNAYDG